MSDKWLVPVKAEVEAIICVDADSRDGAIKLAKAHMINHHEKEGLTYEGKYIKESFEILPEGIRKDG